MQVGLPTVAFIVLMVLKLTDVIDWSWWWITAPLWGYAIVVGVVLVIGGTVAAWGSQQAPSRSDSYPKYVRRHR